MTRQEFIDGFCKKSKMTPEELFEYFVVLPCNCGDSSCKGWATVFNDKAAIEHHVATGGREDE